MSPRQLGHADPAITLRVYADEFAGADKAERTPALLDPAVGNTLETIGGDERQTAEAPIAQLSAIGD
jgi:hypothetical protein